MIMWTRLDTTVRRIVDLMAVLLILAAVLFASRAC
jgi:hypothetical protein